MENLSEKELKEWLFKNGFRGESAKERDENIAFQQEINQEDSSFFESESTSQQAASQNESEVVIEDYKKAENHKVSDVFIVSFQRIKVLKISLILVLLLSIALLAIKLLTRYFL